MAWDNGTTTGRTGAVLEGGLLDRSPGYFVEAYGAVGDGTTNDSAAIQAAIDAAAANTTGGRVIFDALEYGITTAIDMKRQVSLHGTHHAKWLTGTGYGTRLKALAGFSGTGVVQVRESAVIGGTGTHGVGLHGLRIDGNAIATNALYMQGQVIQTLMTDVEVTGAVAVGMRIVQNATRHSQLLYMDRVYARANGTIGFDFDGPVDLRADRCMAMSNTSHGWRIQNGGFSEYTGCGAEWNLGQGLRLDGGGDMDGLVFNSFRTDSNYDTGVFVGFCPSNSPIVFNNLYLRRDGRNLGATYGLSVGGDTAGFSPPVFVNGITVVVKQDDGGGTLYRPLFGVRVGGNNDTLRISGGTIWGVTAAFSENTTADKLRVGKPMVLITGNPGAQVLTNVTVTTSEYTVD